MNELSPFPRLNEELSGPVRIPVEAYISADYARAEQDRLWRKVWVQAGRVEDIPEPGAYITYDLGSDSALIVRDPRVLERLHPSRAQAGRNPQGRTQRARHPHELRLRVPRMDVRT